MGKLAKTNSYRQLSADERKMTDLLFRMVNIERSSCFITLNGLATRIHFPMPYLNFDGECETS